MQVEGTYIAEIIKVIQNVEQLRKRYIYYDR